MESCFHGQRLTPAGCHCLNATSLPPLIRLFSSQGKSQNYPGVWSGCTIFPPPAFHSCITQGMSGNLGQFPLAGASSCFQFCGLPVSHCTAFSFTQSGDMTPGVEVSQCSNNTHNSSFSRGPLRHGRQCNERADNLLAHDCTTSNRTCYKTLENNILAVLKLLTPFQPKTSFSQIGMSGFRPAKKVESTPQDGMSHPFPKNTYSKQTWYFGERTWSANLKQGRLAKHVCFLGLGRITTENHKCPQLHPGA